MRKPFSCVVRLSSAFFRKETIFINSLHHWSMSVTSAFLSNPLGGNDECKDRRMARGCVRECERHLTAALSLMWRRDWETRPGYIVKMMDVELMIFMLFLCFVLEYWRFSSAFSEVSLHLTTAANHFCADEKSRLPQYRIFPFWCHPKPQPMGKAPAAVDKEA